MTDSAKDTATLRTIAGEAVAAYARPGSQLASFSARYPALTLANAYRVTAQANAKRVAKGETAVGRKVGFTNRQIWSEYGVHGPNWGYIYDSTLHHLCPPAASFRGAPEGGEPGMTAEIPVVSFAEPKIEPEIMFGLAKAPSPGMDDAALLACVAWIAHGFEIVQSIFPDWKFS